LSVGEKQRIELMDVEEITTEVKISTVFDLTDAIGHQNPEKEVGERPALLEKDGRYIEISVVLMGYKKPGEKGVGGQGLQKEEPLDLILRFVKEVVQRNRGTMRIDVDEEKARTFISLRFPVERRKVVYYQSAN